MTRLFPNLGVELHIQKCIVSLQRNLQALVHGEDKKESTQDVLSSNYENYTKEIAYQSVIDLARKWQHKYKSLSYKILNMEWPP